MLVELCVRNLGVIEDLTLTLGPGMTALTGETGAGKTLVIEAIELLVGGRPVAGIVRPGADEAWVEGRFAAPGGTEVILGRAIPATGRSRAYVDGRMAPAAALAEWGSGLVDLHGQHDHQSLLAPAVQRRALDTYGHVDRSKLDANAARIKALDEALRDLGGDARARNREIDLLGYQLAELGAASLDDPDEERLLEHQERVLAEAQSWREAAAAAEQTLSGEGGAREALGTAAVSLRGRPAGGESPFVEVVARLVASATEVGDAARDLRAAAEAISEDPGRLAAIQTRRRLLRELRRKYGDTLASVMTYAQTAASRLAELHSHDERAEQLGAERTRVAEAAFAAAVEVAEARRAAAPGLAREIERHLHGLALPRARFSVEVNGEPPADDVVFAIGANPGEPVAALARVASGGELARIMLAARLVLTAGPPTLVFDEVDAGVGGAAATAVGRALALVGSGEGRQVLVVTHLPQVAAFADAQIGVTKVSDGARTVARATPLAGEERVLELSRMLAGRPDSDAARTHAAELLAAAAAERLQPISARSEARATPPSAGRRQPRG